MAKAYYSVREEIAKYSFNLFKKENSIFTSLDEDFSGNQDDWSSTYFSNIKDFHSAGKISSALGIPMHRLTESKYKMPDGKEIGRGDKNSYDKSIEDLENFVEKIN